MFAGDRTVNLTFSMDSVSYPIDDHMTRSFAINAIIFVTILENDPLTLPITGLTSSLRVYVIQGSVAYLGCSLPQAPTAVTTLHITMVTLFSAYC